MILNVPNQRRFLPHCAATGKSTNDSYKEFAYSLRTFIDRVLVFSGAWELVHQDRPASPAHLARRLIYGLVTGIFLFWLSPSCPYDIY